MQLCNVNIVGHKNPEDIELQNGIIKAISSNNKSSGTSYDKTIYFKNAIAFPGLINSHDHLDFNLFPRTGNRIYNNYTEWGRDIHSRNKEIINTVLKVPQHARTQSGIYKNLLNGFTTVVNHGEKLTIENSPINVIQNNHCLHSILFEKNWRFKLNNIFSKHRPFVIHVGEGTDRAAHQEIDELIKWNLFKRKLIGVHGVAMDDEQATSFKALVWCPASNYFLLNDTAPVDELKTKTNILFGTDSTLTSGWNLWEHIRLARNTLLVSHSELFDMLTEKPATVWGLKRSGKIEQGYIGDIVIAKKMHGDNFDSFFSVNPEDILLVIHRGEICLFDEELYDQVSTNFVAGAFSKIQINQNKKYVLGEVPALLKEVLTYYPEASLPISV